MSSHLIQIDTLSGASLSVDGNGALTVWQVKRSIKESIGVPRRLQRLVKGTRIVGNNEVVRQECMLTLVTLSGSCHVFGLDATKSCSRCFSVRYCSESCQGSDWRRHKLQCIAIE